MRQETTEKLTKNVAERLGVGTDEIIIRRVAKDNGLVLTGMMLKSRSVGAVCYIDDIAEDLESGRLPIEYAAKEIARNISNVPLEIADRVDQIGKMDKETLLEGVQIRLLNAERNESVKEQCPYFEYIDLIGVFQYRLSKSTSFRITNMHAKVLDVSLEELKEAGLKNTEKEARTRNMSEFMNELALLSGQRGHEEDEAPLYVMTNSDGYYGASIMLIPESFEALANKLESDLYIFPSSKHEVLAIPKNEEEKSNFSMMVHEINDSVVESEDFLSNTVYQYTRGSGVIDVAV